MKDIRKEETKEVEEVKVNKEEPKTIDVKCVRRHLNDEYKRAIEVGEVITVKSDYAKYLKEIGVVE